MFVDSLGFVHLEGWAQKVGSPGDFAFVLPSADRPSATLTFPAVDQTGLSFVSLTIFPTGEVYIPVASGDLVSLSGVSFQP